jgi:hypothetical protein
VDLRLLVLQRHIPIYVSTTTRPHVHRMAFDSEHDESSAYLARMPRGQRYMPAISNGQCTPYPRIVG